MFIKSDANFSIFISDLRKLQSRERTVKILAERRRMIECDNKNLEQSNVLKMIYVAINQQEVDTMLFIKALGSMDLNTKKYGYLGLSMSEDDEYFVLTFNTLMKDLQNKHTREMALNFLCNVNTNINVYNDLAGYICTRNNSDKFIIKSTIAKCKMTENERIFLVGNNENLIFTKIQIIINKMLTNEDVNLMDNDKSFLYAYYGTTSNSFLKVKLIQIYKLLNEKSKLNLSKSFYQCIEKDVILPHESIKPLVDISLSIEIVDLFLSTSNVTQKIESFLFRLIDSQNTNSRYMGFKLSMKFKLFPNQVIDKSIKWGLHNADCYEALLFFINKTTHKDIYKRKEEIRFMMEKQGVKEQVAKQIMSDVLIKILEHSKDEMYLKVYYENPEICFIKEFDRKISDEMRLIYFNKLLQKNKIKYFYLLYSLIPRNYNNPEFNEELFRNHLNIIVNSKTIKGPRILERLIMAIVYFDKLDLYRDMLLEKFFEVPNEFKQVMRDGICLMNTKCKNKALVLENNNVVIKYSLTGNLLKLKIKGNIDCLEIKNKKEKLRATNVYTEEYHNIFEYELTSPQNVVLSFISNNAKCVKDLYFY